MGRLGARGMRTLRKPCHQGFARETLGQGFSVEHYSAQDKPLFEMIEGEGEKQQVKPLFRFRKSFPASKRWVVVVCPSSGSKAWAK